MKDRCRAIAKLRALVDRRQKACTPVLWASQHFLVVAHDYERREVPIRSAQPVCDPCSQGGTPGEDRSRVHLADRPDMIQAISPDGPNQCKIVNVLCDIRKPIGNSNSTLPIALEGALARH